MSIKSKIHVNTHYTRSINIQRDANSLEVIKAYIPTSRALKLFIRVSEGFHTRQAPRAWSLIGPYGSGKSSSSVFLSHLLSSPEFDTTKAAFKNLRASDQEVAKPFQKEVSGSSGYLKVLITGSPEPMGNKIASGIYVAAETFFKSFRGPSPKIVRYLVGTH
jgi:hypothetical protein